MTGMGLYREPRIWGGTVTCPDCDKDLTEAERVSGMCGRCWCLLPAEVAR